MKRKKWLNFPVTAIETETSLLDACAFQEQVFKFETELADLAEKNVYESYNIHLWEANLRRLPICICVYL